MYNNTVKVIPQKLNLPMDFFYTFPKCSLPSTVSKNAKKFMGHHSRLRDMEGQSYPIHGCTRVNDARYSSVHFAVARNIIYLGKKKLDR